MRELTEALDVIETVGKPEELASQPLNDLLVARKDAVKGYQRQREILIQKIVEINWHYTHSQKQYDKITECIVVIDEAMNGLCS